MKHVQLLLFALGSFFLISETHGQHSSNTLEDRKRDLLQAGDEFKCPFVFGSFSDPDDCSHYYVCIAGKAFRKKCRTFLAFDYWTRKCVSVLIATCGDKKDKSTTPAPGTTTTETTTEGNSFVCTSFVGNFPHPDDCSKYYSCFFYKATMQTCPEKELFDAVQKKCQPEDKVHCGTRRRPVDLTTIEIPDVTTTNISITPSVKEETPEETDATTDHKTDFTRTPLETTMVSITTIEIQPTGPPEHDCKENDLDCIITETGDVSDWFKCPEDIASYPHPSSDKLFIFCMNWIPSVKKCGQNLIFSRELLTCIEAFL